MHVWDVNHNSKLSSCGIITVYGCQILQPYIHQELDGGDWQLVWKLSYLQVSRSVQKIAMNYRKTSEPCIDLSDGWCNVPNKQLPRATEQMIAAFHHGTVVYAYKSPLNPNLGVTDEGARLMSGWSKIVDKCTQHNGVRPDIYINQGALTGIAFDKRSPDDIRLHSDTVSGGTWSDRRWRDLRWYNCHLPSSISSTYRRTQMTVAIFVR